MVNQKQSLVQTFFQDPHNVSRITAGCNHLKTIEYIPEAENIIPVLAESLERQVRNTNESHMYTPYTIQSILFALSHLSMVGNQWEQVISHNNGQIVKTLTHILLQPYSSSSLSPDSLSPPSSSSSPVSSFSSSLIDHHCTSGAAIKVLLNSIKGDHSRKVIFETGCANALFKLASEEKEELRINAKTQIKIASIFGELVHNSEEMTKFWTKDKMQTVTRQFLKSEQSNYSAFWSATTWCSVISKCATFIPVKQLGLGVETVKKFFDLIHNFPSFDRLRGSIMSMLDKVSERSEKFKKQVAKISDSFFQQVRELVDNTTNFIDEGISIVTNPIDTAKKHSTEWLQKHRTKVTKLKEVADSVFGLESVAKSMGKVEDAILKLESNIQSFKLIDKEKIMETIKQVINNPINKLQEKVNSVGNLVGTFSDNMINKVRNFVENSISKFKPSALLFNSAIKIISGLKFDIGSWFSGNSSFANTVTNMIKQFPLFSSLQEGVASIVGRFTSSVSSISNWRSHIGLWNDALGSLLSSAEKGISGTLTHLLHSAASNCLGIFPEGSFMSTIMKSVGGIFEFSKERFKQFFMSACGDLFQLFSKTFDLAPFLTSLIPGIGSFSFVFQKALEYFME